METLPLSKKRLMDYQYIPVAPLMPLKALTQRCFSKSFTMFVPHPGGYTT